MAVQVTRRQWTATEYDRMIELGIIQEHDRVELLDGEIIEKSPIGTRHAACVSRLNALLTQWAGDRALISVQNPVLLNEHSEPEPDIAVLKPRADFYAYDRPTGTDILVAIEVADTSLEYDREVKIPRYAEAGIGEVWLLDLRHQMVTVYTQPTAQTYQTVQHVQGEEAVPSIMLANFTVRADEILW